MVHGESQSGTRAVFSSEEGDSESDLDVDNEDEENTAFETTLCLFCEKSFCSIDAALSHLDSAHDVKLSYFKAKFKMDQHSYIKLINYIRGEKISPTFLLDASEAFWNDEKYLKPLAYEPWLTYDFEEMPSDDISFEVETNNESHLKAAIEALRKKCETQESLLEQAMQDILKMRIGFQRLVDNEQSLESIPNQHDVASKLDDAYFYSYAHFGIHHEMLSDVVRTKSYRDAFLLNKQFFNGKDVLDVGCGTAVLSLFASQAGAKQVVGVDNSDIVYNAMDIVRKNNVNNVTLVKGRLEDTTLPLEKYDVIISEWMGYFLLFEGMLDSMIYARDNHLKKGGILLPNRCTMSLVGCGDESLYKKHVTFWDDVYGFNMSTMKKQALQEPLIENVSPDHILTISNTIAEFDMSTVDINYPNFVFNFNLKCIKAGNLSSFIGYFDVFFELPHKVSFGTGPLDNTTHWKNVVFFLDQPHIIEKDDTVEGKIMCQRNRRSVRSLEITIVAFGKKYMYYLD